MIDRCVVEWIGDYAIRKTASGYTAVGVGCERLGPTVATLEAARAQVPVHPIEIALAPAAPAAIEPAPARVEPEPLPSVPHEAPSKWMRWLWKMKGWLRGLLWWR